MVTERDGSRASLSLSLFLHGVQMTRGTKVSFVCICVSITLMFARAAGSHLETLLSVTHVHIRLSEVIMELSGENIVILQKIDSSTNKKVLHWCYDGIRC